MVCPLLSLFVSLEKRTRRSFDAYSYSYERFSLSRFQDPGWEHCGRLLDEIYFGRVKCVISAIQLSELYTPFKRAGDIKGLERLKREHSSKLSQNVLVFIPLAIILAA